jgi:hypothetical protein
MCYFLIFITPRRQDAKKGALLPNCAIPTIFFLFFNEMKLNKKDVLRLVVNQNSLRLRGFA